MTFDPTELRKIRSNDQSPFNLRKIGHVVLRTSDMKKSVDFYVKVMGFSITDIYPEDMVPGGMVFMRFSVDHHGVALVGGVPGRSELREHKVPIVFEGRRRAGVQIAVEFLDPDGHNLEIYWGLDRIGADGKSRPKTEWREAHTLEEALENPPPGQRVELRDRSLIERR